MCSPGVSRRATCASGRVTIPRIREQILQQTEQEVPYSTAVLIDAFDESEREVGPRGLVRIAASVLVERESQKAIVIGKGGQRLKEIGASARAQIAEHLGRPVHLFLHVKVNPRWDEDRGLYREIGLEWTD